MNKNAVCTSISLLFATVSLCYSISCNVCGAIIIIVFEAIIIIIIIIISIIIIIIIMKIITIIIIMIIIIITVTITIIIIIITIIIIIVIIIIVVIIIVFVIIAIIILQSHHHIIGEIKMKSVCHKQSSFSKHSCNPFVLTEISDIQRAIDQIVWLFLSVCGRYWRSSSCCWREAILHIIRYV